MPSEDGAVDLLGLARAAAARAYAPYSNFRVGAAMLDAGGQSHVGCNIESASYGLTVCAERTAIFSAIAAGAPRPFTAIAISCLDGTTSPCGACRQVMVEHFPPDAPVELDGRGSYLLADLLPLAFQLPD